MKCWLACSIAFLLSGCCISQDETTICVLLDIPNGFFMEPTGSFNISNTTTYGCQIGFTTPQGLPRGETTCLLDGWVPKPECIKTCPKPVDENIIFSTTKPAALLEEKLIFECTDGYETINQKRGGQAVCTLKGWNPKPQCLSIECEIPILEHGSIHPRKDQYVNRDVVRFSCIRGYTRVGSDSAQCYHFGWSPPPPTCKEKVTPCQQPPRISHGNLIGDLHEEYQHGEKVAYECDIRFGMVGSSTVECVDGEWMFLPSCIGRCPIGYSPEATESCLLTLQFSQNRLIKSEWGRKTNRQ